MVWWCILSFLIAVDLPFRVVVIVWVWETKTFIEVLENLIFEFCILKRLFGDRENPFTMNCSFFWVTFNDVTEFIVTFQFRLISSDFLQIGLSTFNLKLWYWFDGRCIEIIIHRRTNYLQISIQILDQYFREHLFEQYSEYSHKTCIMIERQKIDKLKSIIVCKRVCKKFTQWTVWYSQKIRISNKNGTA